MDKLRKLTELQKKTIIADMEAEELKAVSKHNKEENTKILQQENKLSQEANLITSMLKESEVRRGETYKRISEGIDKLKQDKTEIMLLKEKGQALKKFKEETGLKGPELKKAFEEFWEKKNF